MKGWAIRKVTNPGMASPEEEIMLEFTTTQIEGQWEVTDYTRCAEGGHMSQEDLLTLLEVLEANGATISWMKGWESPEWWVQHKKEMARGQAEGHLKGILAKMTDEELDGVLQVMEWFDKWIPKVGKTRLMGVLREICPVRDDPAAADALANHEVMEGGAE